MRSLSFLLLLSASVAQATDTDWVNFIRQNQIDSGVTWDMPVAPDGDAPSHLSLEEGGALFQLWTIKQSEIQDYLLDQRLVGTYLPSAEIRIETSDPYPHVHRTRADQPFTVHIEVNGLLAGQNIPSASKQVLLEHHLAAYTGSQQSIDPNVATSGTPSSEGLLQQNGTHTMTFTSTSLPATDPTAAMGEEHFVVHALPDASIPQTQLATNFVQIWPVASGLIQGLTPGQVIRGEAPTITLNLEDLYPSSTTYLQIYPGSASLGTDGTTVNGSVLVLDQDSSAHRVLPVDDWGELLEEDGIHTLEIVTITPFGTERLSYVEFMVNRELRVNAQLGSIETNNTSATGGNNDSPRN